MFIYNSKITLRYAHSTDARRIQAIYRPYILNTIYNLDSEVPSLTKLRKLISNSGPNLPFIVAEHNNLVIGFAYISSFYDYPVTNTGLLSIYVAEDCSIRGMGKRLLNEVESCLLTSNIKNIVSSIVTDNQRSIHFHQKNGFTEMMYFPNFACKNGRFLDIVWMRKPLNTLVETGEYQAAEITFNPLLINI